MKENQPVFLFEITSKCEYKCNPCYENILITGGHDDQHLWEWFVIIESIAEQEGKLIIAGGDPFLRDDLCDIISYATVLGIEVELAVCGIIITHERVREMKKNGIDRVIIRLDGVNPTVADTFRYSSSYEEVLEAVNLLRENEIDAALVINSDAHKNRYDEARRFASENKIAIYTAEQSGTGSHGFFDSKSSPHPDIESKTVRTGSITDPEGRIFRLHPSLL